MLKIPIVNSADVLESMKLQKRVQFEEERKKRIFNAKERLFGVSKEQQLIDHLKV